MKQRPRIYYSAEQRNLMWDRWQKGDSMHAIARLFDRGHSSVQGILSETVGIRPAQRRRSRLTLTLAEREEISRGIEFVRDPKTADYGTVAVFKDLYGNLWDLLEYAPDHPMNA